jgi:Zn-dependent peptidase ImmA (M78 family)/DNA-binding XRE family transcriptional regulator
LLNPGRLTLARQRRGLTKKALAEAVGLTVRSVSGFENGDMAPSEQTVGELAKALRFPTAFLLAPDLDAPSPESASFRALSSMTAAQRDSALGAGAIAIALSEWIEARFNVPSSDLPDLRGVAPEAAAESVRSSWDLGQLPIRNMVHLLESHGVRVFSLAEKCRQVDAFSLLWKGTTPYVFLNTLKSAEHSRFDAAHELGHLVLHRHGEPAGRQAELEADAFASAFLMPKGSVLSSAPQLPSLDAVVKLKRNWNVSVAALVRRLFSVGMLSEWHYRSLCIQLSQKGYRTQEPNPIGPERSQVLEKVLTELRKESVGLPNIARDLHVFASDLDEIVFGLATVSISGAAQGAADRMKARAHLRLV